MEPPLIGITAGNHPTLPGSYVLRWDYVRSVESVGGVPIVLAPKSAAAHASLMDRLDGLMLTGGMDVDPALYGASPHPATRRISNERDEFEILLLRRAFTREMPILGICRGQQILNVVLDGTLVQDIPTCKDSSILHDESGRPRHQIAHSVRIAEGSRLHQILNCSTIDVNSFHHQAVNRLGRDLVATAWADDEIIEAVEMPSYPFCLGVQWHPEPFWNSGAQFTALFREFMAEARKYRT